MIPAEGSAGDDSNNLREQRWLSTDPHTSADLLAIPICLLREVVESANHRKS